MSTTQVNRRAATKVEAGLIGQALSCVVPGCDFFYSDAVGGFVDQLRILIDPVDLGYDLLIPEDIQDAAEAILGQWESQEAYFAMLRSEMERGRERGVKVAVVVEALSVMWYSQHLEMGQSMILSRIPNIDLVWDEPLSWGLVRPYRWHVDLYYPELGEWRDRDYQDHLFTEL